MQFMRVRFGELIDARIAFEPQLAATAATHRNAEQLAELFAAATDMAVLTSDKTRFRTPYNQFHRSLAEACDNPVLLMAGVTFRKVWDVVHSEITYTRESLTATARAHHELAEAVAARDAAAATALSHGYLLEYRAWLRRHRPELLERPVRWISTT
jgi:DNA-binding FadR family transcriptional regulator